MALYFFTRKDMDMENVEMKVEENILIIEVDLTKESGPSKTGKSITVASTKGNVPIPGNPDIKIGLNVYKKR